ncbi:Cysteine-rich secretory protein family [Phytophthora infestans]|uniref:Cysteine-rich secretory protein family n=1 Tax=Phytophthora infestans TaxID=4787 RepID=A0A833SP16_PHYIN|nr:Cysteine-rich secretory protein family [Phytophthora infestans]
MLSVSQFSLALLLVAATASTDAIPSGDYFSAMLTAVNQERAKQGVPALCMNKKLQAAAQRHSDDMAKNNYMAHDGADGSTMSQRITQAGYEWDGCAENVAAGQEEVVSVMKGWIESPGHYENIMNKDYTMFGTAFSYNKDRNPRGSGHIHPEPGRPGNEGPCRHPAPTTPAPVSTPASTTPAPVSTPASTTPAPVVTPASTTPAPEATPAATTPAPEATPAATTPAPEATPAATTPAPEATPAATTPAPEATPAATTPAPEVTPAATTTPPSASQKDCESNF